MESSPASAGTDRLGHHHLLWPGPATGQTVFETSTAYRGRTMAVARVTSRNAAGKICTLATVTSHRGD